MEHTNGTSSHYKPAFRIPLSDCGTLSGTGKRDRFIRHSHESGAPPAIGPAIRISTDLFGRSSVYAPLMLQYAYGLSS